MSLETLNMLNMSTVVFMAITKIPIQKKAVNFLFWSFTFVLGAVALFHFWTLGNDAVNRAKSDTLNVATALKEYTLRQISMSDIQMSSLVRSAEFKVALKEKNEKQLHEFLQNLRFIQDPVEEYFVVDDNGQLLASSLKYPVKKENFKDAAFFNFHYENSTKDIHVGDVMAVHEANNYEIPFSKRLHLGDGHFSGVIGMWMNPRSYQGFFQHLMLQPEDSIAILDEKGMFLMRFPWRKEVVGKITTKSTELVSAVYNIPYGNTNVISSIDGKSRVVGFINFEKYPMLAIAARKTSVVYANIWKSVYLLVPIYFGLVWLAFYLSRAFLRSEFRLRHEVERAMLFEDTLKFINNHTSKEIGQKFLDSLVSEMSKVLKCRYVYVGELSADRRKVVTLAMSLDGKIIPNVEYDIINTPCEGILREEVCYYSRNVQKAFPDDKMLMQFGVESYLGVSLFDFRGEVLGLIVGLNDQPMDDSDLITTVFSIFAARAGAEIERLRSEKSRLDTEEMKRNLETQTAQSQKMESIGRLASGIAHDFNNVLAAITANLEFARLKIEDKPVAMDYINRADKASDRARDLVRQILTFNRKGNQESKALDLSLLIQDVSEILRAGIGAHIEIRTLILDYDLKIFGNSTQLHQVLMNLCTNAAQAITSGTGLIEIILERSGDEALLTVRDNGVGMDAEIQSKIFEPFFTTKTPGQGTGLGLAVVQGIVKSHSGYIELKSAPEKGTEFILHFPLYLKHQAKNGTRKLLQLPKGHGQNILVVDDESTMVELACEILNDHGYKSRGFTFPQQAYDAFMKEPLKFSLVITDLTMPGMRGEELAKKIREVRRDIPVIFTTGLDTELNQLQNFEGPYVTLQKPYNLWTLVDAVGKFLKNLDITH